MSNAVTTRVWVSCEDTSSIGVVYKMWAKKPRTVTQDGCDYFYGGDLLRNFCCEHFEAMTPIRLKAGTCKQFDITISATEVKEST